jgi:hypothetical protein
VGEEQHLEGPGSPNTPIARSAQHPPSLAGPADADLGGTEEAPVVNRVAKTPVTLTRELSPPAPGRSPGGYHAIFPAVSLLASPSGRYARLSGA